MSDPPVTIFPRHQGEFDQSPHDPPRDDDGRPYADEGADRDADEEPEEVGAHGYTFAKHDG